MTDVINVSATEARNNFFELFNQVYYGKKIVVVRKAKKRGRVRIVADLPNIEEKVKAEDFIKETYGCLADKRKTYWSSEDADAKKKQISLQKKKLKEWL